MQARTNCGENASNGLVVLVGNNLILPHDTGADALDDTNLAGTLVLELSQAERKGLELAHDLRQRGAGARSLKLVRSRSPSVEGGPLLQCLDLARTQTDAHFNTPHFGDCRYTITASSLAGCQNDLLGAFDLVVLKQPARGVLNEVAVVALDDLLK